MEYFRESDLKSGKLLVPTLEDIASVSVAVKLYNDYEMQHSLKGAQLFLTPGEKWKTIMIEYLPNHVYSRPLQQKIMSFMKLIPYEVKMWKEQHETFVGNNLDPRILNAFQWKSHGTIDRLKTANVLIQSDLLQMWQRFRLACNYWEKKSVLLIWEEMPTVQRKYFQRKFECGISDLVTGSDRTVAHWILWYTERERRKFKKKFVFDNNWDSVSLQGLFPQKLTSRERRQMIQHDRRFSRRQI
ncbi:hypothetical protein NPIL_319861 [Nephila pilipes]|uniref:Uncharacterized protein n=1 Tax=Nephila pilipes TaxID=299642 RepID=A0A8X6UND5_NEPPI|nr:hypothetical protein NPIL_319861 [Nephila pilipes]